ncbi:uncharacterized protein LOC141606220 [Silene latifolia]|uniref:uncharacterized protein LOC141606220 n=1 Tax=Silene latifolia TaxID=37657 RepID=UPI003D76CA19
MMFGENVAEMDRGTVDRISELPEFILHSILSNLDTKEVYRTSVLSKRWYDVWSSVPVLDFQSRYYKKEYWNCLFHGASVNDDVIQSFLGFIDRTMQRYDTRKYRIRKLHLELPRADEKIELLVDKWLRIAVQNQVEELLIRNFPFCSRETPFYRLPEILFRAKSLKDLHCSSVVLPYYETMELISLEYLTLLLDTVDTDLLQRIISFCPLVELDITVSYLGEISLPWERKVNKGAEVFGTEITQSKFKASPLRKFAYSEFNRVIKWPLNMNVVALKNLRELQISSATITDDIVSKLAYGLVALESLVLDSCSMLKCIMISSISLKELRIKEGLDLVKVTVDAPNLIKFLYCCEVETSLSLIRVLDHCNAQFSLLVGWLFSITTDWLVKLKKILEEKNFFQSLAMELCNYLQTEVEEQQLRNVVTGPSYKLGKLELRDTRALDGIESSLVALDALFWICHPDVLSITTCFQKLSAESILNILKCKVQCWKHPLKSIEVEDIDGSSCHPRETEFRFRLSWL